nr:unnamed protein product [Callosobruchus analis]
MVSKGTVGLLHAMHTVLRFESSDDQLAIMSSSYSRQEQLWHCEHDVSNMATRSARILQLALIENTDVNNRMDSVPFISPSSNNDDTLLNLNDLMLYRIEKNVEIVEEVYNDVLEEEAGTSSTSNINQEEKDANENLEDDYVTPKDQDFEHLQSSLESDPNLDAPENLENDNVTPKDQDFEPSECSSENETNLDGDSTEDDVSKQKRKRSRMPKKEEWSREKAKIRRMNGMSYIGYTRDRKGKVFHNKERENRVMGPRCQSNKCMKYKNRFCINMSEDERNSIFKKFWEDMSWDQKKIYVSNLVQKKDIERKFVENSRRSSTYNYFLKIGHENKQVCKSMFLSTLGLNEWMVANWCSTAVNGMIPSATISNASRRAARPKAVNDKRVEYLNTFFDDLPKMPSHYCRRDSKKLYLLLLLYLFFYNFESKANLYRVYKENCLTGQVAPLSTTFFSETFENLGLAIFTPKKDQCNLCVSFKAGNVDAAEYNRHIELNNLARHVKEADKISAIEGLCHAFVMDVQAVKMSPVNNANKFYFKTRLKVHNLTIYDMSTHHIRPGRSVNDPTVNNLRVLHYSPNSRIGYKLHFHDEMMELPQRSRYTQNCKDATRLFPARLKITQLKYDHLQEIKSTLDAEVHHFYNNLPH